MKKLRGWYFEAACWMAFIVISISGIANGKSTPEARTVQQYIAQLDTGLDSLQKEIKGQPQHPLIFSVNLFYAHGSVIQRFPVDTLRKCVDAFHEAGARRVDINLAIDPWRDKDPEIIQKYDAIIAHIRQLGMQLAINPEVMHRHAASETFETWKAAALKAYPEIARRYQPDVFSVIHEPTTMAARLMPGILPQQTQGYVPAVSRAIGPQQWADFVEAAAAAIKTASPKTRCAAGVLYYERPFFKEFLRLKNLDAISLDIYSLKGMSVYDEMIEAAHRQGKTVYIEESWRETYTDPMFQRFRNITPRPGGDIAFEALDSKWLETLSRYASVRRLEAITACGVTSMQSLFYYSEDSHNGNLDPVYIRRVVEAVNRGDRTPTFGTLKRLAAQYEE